MEKHEKGCTNNPDRDCGMCGVGGTSQEPMDALVACINPNDKEGTLDRLDEITEGCQACILAALRRWQAQNPESLVWFNFDFKEAVKKFWDGVNEARDEERYAYH